MAAPAWTDVTAGRGCDLQEAWPGRGEGEGRTAAHRWDWRQGRDGDGSVMEDGVGQ